MRPALRRSLYAAGIGLAIIACIYAARAQSAAPSTPPPAPTPPVAKDAELFALIATRNGPIRLKLMTREAPMSCANFVNLVQRGAYDGATFDDWTRVLRQSGGPVHGFDPGYTIRKEFSAKLMFDAPGKVALQKSADGNGAHPTQFFITVKEQSRWDLDVPIFAIVADGMLSVEAVQKGDPITTITIEGDTAPLLTRFAADITRWNAALDAAAPKFGLPKLRAATTAPAVPPATPSPPAPLAPSAPTTPDAPSAPSAPGAPSTPAAPSAPASPPPSPR